jgi:hypothetical protein
MAVMLAVADPDGTHTDRSVVLLGEAGIGKPALMAGLARQWHRGQSEGAVLLGPWPQPAAALETFRHLRADPWTMRAEAELRACGVIARAPSTAPNAIDRLTAQKHEIVTLAAGGLSNSEIADRFFLSHRTVASHLYRSSQNSASPVADSSAASSTRPAAARPLERIARGAETFGSAVNFLIPQSRLACQVGGESDS